MYTLTKQQREYLIMLLDIQHKKIWNNGRMIQLTTIIHANAYNDMDREDLNEMNDGYREFLKIRRINPNYTQWP